jgi:uncharacterized protein YjbJ (UPF0337 family)
MTNPDELKGRAKEAAGALAGDEDLRREGLADQAAGRAQERVEEVKDKVTGGLDEAKEKVEEAAGKIEERLRRPPGSTPP